MIVLFLLSQAAASTVAVERAYAALAQTRGQWTAFRETAAPDAILFVPEPVAAGPWLRDRKDPPISVMWWPGRTWISCDRRLGINFGPWIRRGGKLVGTFTTIWAKQPDGSWKWQLDRGNVTPEAVAAGDAPQEQAASCRHLAAARGASPTTAAAPEAVILVGDTMPRPDPPPGAEGDGTTIKSGASPDGSIKWEAVQPFGQGPAASIFRAWRWDGRAYRLILFESSAGR